MPAALLETKLYAPRPRPGVVSRPRLTELLERGGQAKLTIVSAPPGFGKSTLVADWLASLGSTGHPVSIAWVSLDAGDDESSSFWAYVITALERAAMVGDAASALLESNAVPVESVLTTLLNALRQATGDVVLVLDDYHLIERGEIHEGVGFLLDHLPPPVRLILVTRADPPLPLARLRARGDLSEIRASDLRFTGQEAEAYLNGSMGLTLAARDVVALEGRTEGWIAALQLAALSLRGRSDAPSFIAEFAGDDRYIVDYLAEEVLDRQSEAVQQFLIETSILGRLTGPLCDAVTGRDDGSRTLEALERANLFVIALDDRRRWYRYHHLFADVLRTRALAQHPDAISALHRRASAWFEREGDLPEAIGHAIAGGDSDRAADLIERAAPEMLARRHELAIRRWLDALPDRTFETRPGLAIMHGATRLSTGTLAGVEERLATAERSVMAAGGDAGPATTTARRTGAPAPDASLRSMISLHRAGLARMQGDTARTIAHAEAVLASAGADQPLERGGATALLALADWSSGRLDTAFARWTQSFEYLAAAGRVADLLGLSISMADIRVTQGRLSDARLILERGLQIGTASAHSPLRGVADMHVGLSEIARERNDIPGSEAHLEAAETLGEAMGLPQNAHRLRIARAGVAFAKGDSETALQLLDEAERRYDADFSPNVHPIAARRARVWIVGGDLEDARSWANNAGISVNDDGSFIHEFEHATLARLLVAEGIRDRDDDILDEAVRLAERLLADALAGGRRGAAIDVLVVLALGRQARRDPAGAAESLERAVTLGEPDGWHRVFLDEGASMSALLAAVGGGSASRYLAALRTAPGPRSDHRRKTAVLVDPLSDRELDVLRLLRSDLAGPEIARQMHISLNTLRTHTKSVYAKLGVNSRREAIRRAEELALFSRA